MSSEEWKSEAYNEPYASGQTYTDTFTDSKFSTEFTQPVFTSSFTGNTQEKPRYRTPVLVNGERKELDMHPFWLLGFNLGFVLIICGTILAAFIIISRVAKQQQAREAEDLEVRNRRDTDWHGSSAYPQRIIVQPAPLPTSALPVYSGPILYAPQSPLVNMVNDYSGEKLSPPPYSPSQIPKS